MSGIYIHIPFCHRACNYCDFHFSVSLKNKSEMVIAICKELEFRKNFFSQTHDISTIYFGGGTPSILDSEDIKKIMSTVYENFSVVDKPEITLEANPEDVNDEKSKVWKRAGINRISLGIQSFNNPTLTSTGRGHDSEIAFSSLKYTISMFQNVSIDLMFAISGQDSDVLKKDLRIIGSFKPQHVSVYGLTIEPGTRFGHMLTQGTLKELEDDKYEQQFLLIRETLRELGYEHYETSNYALPGFRSRHNSSYWFGSEYLGIGPSAHSYDTSNRHQNVRNNSVYLRGWCGTPLEGDPPIYTSEELSEADKINDYIMTRMRTEEGILIEEYSAKFGKDELQRLVKTTETLKLKKLIEISPKRIVLSQKGLLLTDYIVRELMFV